MAKPAGFWVRRVPRVAAILGQCCNTGTVPKSKAASCFFGCLFFFFLNWGRQIAAGRDDTETQILLKTNPGYPRLVPLSRQWTILTSISVALSDFGANDSGTEFR